MKTISALESKILDINSEALGVSVDILMDNAGRAIAELLNSRFPGKRIAFVCGNGNNGGDGIAAANMVTLNDATIFLLKPETSIRSEHIRCLLSGTKCPVKQFSEFDEKLFDVIVDCALGTGFTGGVRAPYDSFIKRSNAFSGTVISVDIPSGLGSDLFVIPDITITFHALKEGMNRMNSGEIIVTDISMPAKAEKNIGPGDMLRYPIPKADGHKGNNGRLLVIGGGPYYGAPAISALASLRIGTDIVRIAAPEHCCTKISAVSPVFTLIELPGNEFTSDHIPLLGNVLNDYDAVLIGPGLGTSGPTCEAVRRFISEFDIPVVVDADGLTALGKGFKGRRNIILTPHRKEFERLGGILSDDLEKAVSRLSSDMGAIVLLKGKEDLIAYGDKVRINTTGTPGMTGAGTGDVLAGIVAGLLSKGMSAFDSACLGAYISGRSGEYAFQDRSYGMIATDVIEMIPKVLKDGLGR